MCVRSKCLLSELIATGRKHIAFSGHCTSIIGPRVRHGRRRVDLLQDISTDEDGSESRDASESE